MKENVSLKMMKKYYSLPDTTSSKIRLLEEKDIKSAHLLLSNYLKNFQYIQIGPLMNLSIGLCLKMILFIHML